MKINLSELIITHVGRWPNVVKYFFASIVSSVIISLSYVFLIKSINEQYDTLTLQETFLRNDFEIKQQQAANLDAYLEQLPIINERLSTMLEQLPAQNEMPGMLEDISKAGEEYGLTLELFAPQAEVVKEFYIELPINMSVLGSYHQLATFISRIAQMNRIVTLHNFKIIVHNNKQSDLLELKLTAKIYRYKT